MNRNEREHASGIGIVTIRIDRTWSRKIAFTSVTTIASRSARA
jgi:hypothetical protein